jgi:cell division protein FtsI (penicillin-binding protein 3)
MSYRPSERLLFVSFGVSFVFVAIVMRSLYLQVVAREQILARGDWNHQSERVIQAGRGDIVDRSGNNLARSVHSADIIFDPRHFFLHEAEHEAKLLEVLGSLDGFDLSVFDVWRSERDANTLPRFVRLAVNINSALASEMVGLLRAEGVNALYTESSFQRVYAHGGLASTTLGLAAADGSRGLSGLEMQWEQELTGRAVRVEVQRDSDRRAFQLSEPWELSEARGNTVVTTLDAPLQRFTEDALAATIEEYRAEAGIVIVSRVETGEITTMATWPSYDLNRAFTGGGVLWSNPAVSWVFEPGSTAKMLTFAAAFDAGVLGYNDPIDCGGGATRIGRFTIRDTHRMGTVAAWEVMQHSSNVGTLRIGRRMDDEVHRQYLERFGVGQTVQLLPEGEPGYLPRLPWSEVSQATISYGHGFSATPLQINMATAAIGNGGVLMEPMLVSEIRRSDGTVVREIAPTARGRVVSEEAAELTTRALLTVTQPEGTGDSAVPTGFTVAGKTGTSRLSAIGGYEMEYMASFTGFVPADDPEFAITVMVLRPDKSIGYYGGVVAAPLFREVAAQALLMDGIFPDVTSASLSEAGVVPDEEQAAFVAARAAAANADLSEPVPASAPEGDVLAGGNGVVPGLAADNVMPDLRGLWLSDAISRAGAAGLRVRVHGTGRVARQIPMAFGSREAANGYVELWLETAPLPEQDEVQYAP